MSDTNRTKEAIDIWNSEKDRKTRVRVLRRLAEEAGLKNEFLFVPDIHLEVMDYNKYIMNVLALAKIKRLRELVELQPV